MYSSLGTLNSFVIDMKSDNGLGEVISQRSLFPLPFGSGYREGLNAVKKCSADGYWLISARTFAAGSDQQLTVWSVDGEDGTLTRNDSYYNPEFRISPIELIVSPTGEEICAVSLNSITLFDFDPACGTLERKKTLKAPTSERQPFAIFMGACYSPSGQYLYVSTVGNENGLFGTGVLHQLDVRNSETFNEVQFNDYGLYGLQNGPDGRLYIGTRDNRNGRTGIDRLNKPNEPSTLAAYENRVLELRRDYTWDIRFPTFLHDKTACNNPALKPKVEQTTFCIGTPVVVELNSALKADSVFLVAENELGSFKFSDQNRVLLPLSEVGEYAYKIVWFNCNGINELSVKISVVDEPSFSQMDTLLCSNEALELIPESGLTIELGIENGSGWNSVAADQPIGIEGNYRYIVSNGTCEIEDTFFLDIQEPLITELQNEYTFCESLDELVKLSAGKGFESYRWYPTEDTTEWIDVARQGSYYVVVEDSRGCQGRDDAVVQSDCRSEVFLPNAFSPNGDGLNDVFQPKGTFYNTEEMIIYDRWGGIAFYGTSNELEWDGSKNGIDLPVDVYLCIFRYTGTLTQSNSETITQKLHLVR